METVTNIIDKFFSISDLINTNFEGITGIYCFYYNENPIYVGQTINIYGRMSQHRSDYVRYCGYMENPDVSIVTVKKYNADFCSGANKIRVGSRKLYEFISRIPEGSINSGKNILLDAIKIKILHVCEPSELNDLECFEIDKNHTYIINRNSGLNEFACNLTEGGDNPPIHTFMSADGANLIRKAAVAANLKDMSVADEKKFIADMCVQFNIKNTQSDNPDDNYVRRILRNKWKRDYGPTRFVTEDQLVDAGFTTQEITYFNSCNNAWTDLSKWTKESQSRSIENIIIYAEVYTEDVVTRGSRGSYLVGNPEPLKVFGDRNSNSSCESDILIWLWEHGSKDVQRNIQYLRRIFKRNSGTDRVNFAGNYYWRGIVMTNPSYDPNHKNYTTENLSLDEAFGFDYSNNLDISKALENKDDCISLIKDYYGYSGPIETGGYFILPDGSAVKSTNHGDIDKLLINKKFIKYQDDTAKNNFDYGDGSQFMDAINCVRIRRRGGRDSWILPYMILPEKQLTPAQYSVLEQWIKFVMEKSGELNVQTLDNQNKVFKSSQYSYFDVMDSIRLYYRSHILEDLQEDYEIIFDEE